MPGPKLSTKTSDERMNENTSVKSWSTHSCVVYLEGIRMKRRMNVVVMSSYINACMFVDCVVAVLCTLGPSTE